VLRAAALADGPAATAPDKVSRETRLYVRLAAEDWRLLKERSSARGLPSATYVSLLVRAHLRGVAPLPKTEYLALKQSVVELTGIGRNLNQIARVANQGGRPALPGRMRRWVTGKRLGRPAILRRWRTRFGCPQTRWIHHPAQ
jgi:hypothetical protein